MTWDQRVARRGFGLFTLGMGGLASAASAQPPAPTYPFLRLWASPKLSLELPRSWALVEGTQWFRINTSHAAVRRRLTPLTSTEGETALQAMCEMDGEMRASMGIRLHPGLDLPSQIEIRELSEPRIVMMDGDILLEINQSLTDAGQRLLRWTRTAKVTTRNEVTFLVSEYQHTGPNGRPPMTTRLARCLAGDGSFSLRVGYETAYAAMFRELALHMLESAELRT